MPAWVRPARWSRSRTARSPAGAGRRNPTSCRRGWPLTLGMPVDKVHVIHRPGPAPTAATTPTTAAMDAAVLAKAVGKPVRLQYMRDQGTGWDPKGPASIAQGARGARCRRARSRPTSSPARASRASTSTPMAASRIDTLAGQTHGRGAEIRRRLRHPGGILRLRQQEACRGKRSRRCWSAPRRCARRICAIRSGRRSTSPASRSSTKWRRR